MRKFIVAAFLLYVPFMFASSENIDAIVANYVSKAIQCNSFLSDQEIIEFVNNRFMNVRGEFAFRDDDRTINNDEEDLFDARKILQRYHLELESIDYRDRNDESIAPIFTVITEDGTLFKFTPKKVVFASGRSETRYEKKIFYDEDNL